MAVGIAKAVGVGIYTPPLLMGFSSFSSSFCSIVLIFIVIYQSASPPMSICPFVYPSDLIYFNGLDCGLPHDDVNMVCNLPWIVSFFEFSLSHDLDCSGVLVSPKAILTTKSCAQRY